MNKNFKMEKCRQKFSKEICEHIEKKFKFIYFRQNNFTYDNNMPILNKTICKILVSKQWDNYNELPISNK